MFCIIMTRANMETKVFVPGALLLLDQWTEPMLGTRDTQRPLTFWLLYCTS
jgi:hypothetical protein